MDNPYLGEINLVGFSFAPHLWNECLGQLLRISDNEGLFSILGTTFGGDGRSVFGLPDLRGRVPRGVGKGTGLNEVYWGREDGQENVTMTMDQMPSHTHKVNISSDKTVINNNFAVSVGTTGGSVSSTATTNSLLDSTINSGYREGATDTIELNNSVTGTISLDGITASASSTGGKPSTGEAEGFSILNPFQGLIYAISMSGMYPPRN